jgi:regulator of nucleoside diphosphate kinase
MTRKPAPPRIFINEDLVDHLEKIAEGALRRSPDLADRLLSELARAQRVPAAKVPADVVTIGNRATFRDETTGKERSVTLSFPEDADISVGRISVMTPIGVALLGLREGARFDWETTTGETRQLTVISVTPETTGDSGATGNAAGTGNGPDAASQTASA